jgi:hypothetical protein
MDIYQYRIINKEYLMLRRLVKDIEETEIEKQ